MLVWFRVPGQETKEVVKVDPLQYCTLSGLDFADYEEQFNLNIEAQAFEN